jgi:hypothetical protein
VQRDLNNTTAMARRNLELISAFTLMLAFFFYISQERLAAGDEGFYLSAAKLWAEGKSLYFDFFFPQMPLMPWFYGLIFKIIGTSWISARFISAVLSAACGLIIFLALRPHGRKTSWLGALLFSSHSMVFPWYPVAKSNSLAMLCLLTSFYLSFYVIRYARQKYFRWILVTGGLFFGFSIEARLFFAGMGPVFAFMLAVNNSTWKSRFESIASFATGTLIALIPCYLLMIKDFDIFWFNNLGYHLIRDVNSQEIRLHEKITILKTIFSLRDAVQIEGFQFLLIFVFSAIYQIITWQTARRFSEPFLFGIGMIILNFIPTPSYVQYFSTAVPFLVLGAAPIIGSFSTIGASVFLVGYLAFTPPDFMKYTETGNGVLGITPGDQRYKKIRVLKEIGEAVSRNVPPGVPVLTDWPGLLIDSHVTFYPRVENQFGKKFASRVFSSQRQKYKIATIGEIKNFVFRKSTQFILIEDRDHKVLSPDLRPRIVKEYDHVLHIQGSSLYKRKIDETQKSE